MNNHDKFINSKKNFISKTCLKLIDSILFLKNLF